MGTRGWCGLVQTSWLRSGTYKQWRGKHDCERPTIHITRDSDITAQHNYKLQKSVAVNSKDRQKEDTRSVKQNDSGIC